MKSSRLLKYFEMYVKKFDMNNMNVKARYFHSLKSMDLARDIASSLDIFNEEEIVVCELIALFHDIGGFDTGTNYSMVEDMSNDYSMKSIEILFEGGLLRRITPDTKYDNFIKVAIYAHNKIGLPSNIDNKMKSYCKVIKDAHKIDSFRMVINYPYIDTRIDSYPSGGVYEKFRGFEEVDIRLADNNADEVLVVLSSIFALNYRYSYEVLINENYIGKILNSLTFGDKNVEVFMKQIAGVLSNYLNRKVLV